jgi:prevent-host-death family protein
MTFNGGAMTIIRPISDLRNRTNEISELCHTEDQPIFITKNGQGDLVVMSLGRYDRLQNTLELYRKLGEAETLDAAGEKGITHKQFMRQLKSRIK